MDGLRVIGAEQAHLAERNDDTRRAVVDAYSSCGLLDKQEADNLKSVIDLFGFDFFDLMGLVYANAGNRSYLASSCLDWRMAMTALNLPSTASRVT